VGFEQSVALLAKQYDADIIALPDSLPASIDDWYDCIHYGQSTAQRLATVLANGEDLSGDHAR